MLGYNSNITDVASYIKCLDATTMDTNCDSLYGDIIQTLGDYNGCDSLAYPTLLTAIDNNNTMGVNMNVPDILQSYS